MATNSTHHGRWR